MLPLKRPIAPVVVHVVVTLVSKDVTSLTHTQVPCELCSGQAPHPPEPDGHAGVWHWYVLPATYFLSVRLRMLTQQSLLCARRRGLLVPRRHASPARAAGCGHHLGKPLSPPLHPRAGDRLTLCFFEAGHLASVLAAEGLVASPPPPSSLFLTSAIRPDAATVDALTPSQVLPNGTISHVSDTFVSGCSWGPLLVSFLSVQGPVLRPRFLTHAGGLVRLCPLRGGR